MSKLRLLIEWLLHYAKAIVAIVVPFAYEALTAAVPALQSSEDQLIAAVGTALAVWLIPNLPKPKPDGGSRIPADVSEV